MREQPQQNPYSLPPYPQMIMEAIERFGDASGCNKTDIARYIDITQLDLPHDHMTLLNYHIEQMKQSGQIVLVKNNYMKPDPNAPPKCGRGRPPKPKPQVDSSDVAVPATSVCPRRPRGRPPKSKEPSDSSSIQPKSKEPSVSVRPRGRPPKRRKTDSEEVKVNDDVPTVQPKGERRGRGRPPKVKPATNC